MATIVWLLDCTALRVGNDEYSEANGSFGLTTLRNRHAQVRAGELTLSFKGKSGVQHDLTLSDPRIAKYAFFSGRADNVRHASLLGGDGQLTSIGQAYVDAASACTP